MTSSLLLVLLLLALQPASVSGGTLRKVNIEELTDAADLIFVGEVLSVGQDGAPPSTTYTFEVITAIKGNVTVGQTVTMKQIRSGFVPGIPVFVVGREYLLFLPRASPLGFRSPVGLGQGAFLVSQGQVVNAFDNLALFRDVTRLPNLNLTTGERNLLTIERGPIPLALLLSMLRKLLGEPGLSGVPGGIYATSVGPSVQALGALQVDSAGNPLVWDIPSDTNPEGALTAGQPYNPDRGPLGTLDNASAVVAVDAIFASWGAFPTTAYLADNTGPTPVDIDGTNWPLYLFITGEGINPVAFDHDGSIHDGAFGVGASCFVLGFVSPTGTTSVPPRITDADIVLNGTFIDGIDDTAVCGFSREMPVSSFLGVFTHEFGHSFGLDHTQVNGFALEMGEDTGFGVPPLESVATMYPFALGHDSSTQELDDIIGVSTLYPAGGFLDPATRTGITGTIFDADGITPFNCSNVIARNLADPFFTAASSVSGARGLEAGGAAALDGVYEIFGLPPGDYRVETDVINPNATGGSRIGPCSPQPRFPEEFWDLAESSSDDPTLFDPVAVSSEVTGIDIVLNGNSAILVTPNSHDFGLINVGSTADRTFTVENAGGGTLSGTASTSDPFSIVSGGSFNLEAGENQAVVVRFSPTSASPFVGDVTFTSDAGVVSRTVSGAATDVSAITPDTIDLATPPTSFTITGGGFGDFGFGLSVANFMRGGTLLAQARAIAGTATTLTVPFPTNATSISGPHAGLSEGTVTVQVFNQTGAISSWSLVGSTSLTVNDTRPGPGVAGITPNPIDLAMPPVNFTITGGGFGDSGFGLSVANFMRGGTLLAQARAIAGTATTLTVPFPTNATSISGPHAGLSEGTVTVQVFNQTGAISSWSLVGSTSLTVNDTRPGPSPPGVAGITPNPIDLAMPPVNFTITGGGFGDSGFGLSVVNFTRGGTLLAQARAIAGTTTTLTVPFPTNATSISGPHSGLSEGAVTVQVFNQTGAVSSWSLVGSTSLTVNDTSSPAPPPPGVSAITPDTIDLATAPTSFTITGGGFTDSGFGLSVVNFTRGGTLLAQARATAGSATTLTVPFPTNATSLAGSLPGLSAGTVTVQVFNQTGAISSWSLVGSTPLTVNDTRPSPSPPGVAGITPNPIDLAMPPVNFTITGGGFEDFGFGLPVANFTRGGTLLAQARATAGSATTLTVPFPTNATSLAGSLPGLSAGTVTVQVFNQTGAISSWSLVGSTSLTVNDTRSSPSPPGVAGITPNPIDLATPPVNFTITGGGFGDFGFGLPVANFTRGGTLLAQARAIAGTATTLTVPFPTNATSISGPHAGLSEGTVTVQVFNQTRAISGWSLVGSTSLTVTDSRP